MNYLEKLCGLYAGLISAFMVVHMGQEATTAITLAAHRWADQITAHMAWSN